MIFRCKYSKLGEMAFISHLDLLRIFIRALRREDIRVNYSQGFHPHPKLSFSPALSLGVESICEYMDIDVAADITERDLLLRLNSALPVGVEVLQVDLIEKMGGIASLSTHSKYQISFDKIDDALQKKIERLTMLDEIIIRKKNKKGKLLEVDVKDRIAEVRLSGDVVDVILLNSTNGALKPSEFIDILCNGLDKEYDVLSILKTELYYHDGKELKLVP